MASGEASRSFHSWQKAQGEQGQRDGDIIIYLYIASKRSNLEEMRKFIERQKLQKLIYEEVECAYFHFS